MSKSRHQALVGINFDGLKPPLRIEAGEAIPEKVPQSDISDLLKQGAIRETPEESEGNKK